MNLRRLLLVVNIIAVESLLLQGSYSRAGQGASTVIVEGALNVLWGDGSQGSGETHTEYFLTTTRNQHIHLMIDHGLWASLGGPIGLNQKSVVVEGSWLDHGSILHVQSITLANTGQGSPQGVYGPQPWVSILCKFLNNPIEPKDVAYFKGMYSSEYPGLDHFWRQNSYDLANLEGSGVSGWYVLPHAHDYYVPPGGTLDWWTIAADCTAEADPYVNFSPYVGINLMFNADLDCCAWGGTWYACLDGVCKNWRTTWEPPWGYGNIGVIAHETGHGFGLPHSEGNCQQVYDNRWDVLSDVWSNGDDPVYGTLGQHTIAYHKEILGWMTSAQVFTAMPGTLETITLEKIALPQTDHYLGAVIPIDGQEDHFYTLEVRQPSADPVDYDKWLPGFAVIIHEVTEGEEEPAIVIDQDGDCNTGDAGAMYTPGEVFTDVLHGITVSIESATETGYIVSINNRFTTMQEVDISGAEQGFIEDSLAFTATVSPVDATAPITYIWETGGLPPIQHMDGITDTIDLIWYAGGTKAITVTASNPAGSVLDTWTITINAQIFLPINLRN